MKYIQMTTAAVLQSSSNGKAGWPLLRDTELHPTRSMLTGLLACCLGIKNETEEYKELGEKLHFLTTTSDNVSILDDYQIMSPKEEGKTTGESDMLAVNGSMKKAGSGKVQFHNRYIQDAKFHVLVGCDDIELLKKLHYHMRHPVWPYYLGKAACTPSEPLIGPEFYADELSVWQEKEEYVCI